MGMFKYFELLLAMQLFYAFAITIIAYSLPDDTVNYIIDIENTSIQIQQTIQQQMDIPVVDLGALVFYSGNIIVDLFLNFLTAIPSMFSMVLAGLFAFINVDAFLATQLKLFITTLFTIIYILMLIQFIMNVRARGTIV